MFAVACTTGSRLAAKVMDSSNWDLRPGQYCPVVSSRVGMTIISHSKIIPHYIRFLSCSVPSGPNGGPESFVRFAADRKQQLRSQVWAESNAEDAIKR
jgi:hypothetical protein